MIEIIPKTVVKGASGFSYTTPVEAVIMHLMGARDQSVKGP
jgi:hypothetical protein